VLIEEKKHEATILHGFIAIGFFSSLLLKYAIITKLTFTKDLGFITLTQKTLHESQSKMVISEYLFSWKLIHLALFFIIDAHVDLSLII